METIDFNWYNKFEKRINEIEKNVLTFKSYTYRRKI